MSGPASANGHRPRRKPSRPADWASTAYQPSPDTPLLACASPRCGAKYFDDEPSRAAHVAVFGHRPRPPAADVHHPDQPTTAPTEGETT